MKKRRLPPWFFIILLSLMYIADDSSALVPGAAVYARESKIGDWFPTEYVASRSDCVLLQRLRPHPQALPFLKAPSGVKETEIEVGDEVQETFDWHSLSGSKVEPFVSRVLGIQQRCEELGPKNSRFRQYVSPENMVEIEQFRKLRGKKSEFSVGDTVYVSKYHGSPERWTLKKVIEERSDCFETDSGRTLSGYFGGDGYTNNQINLYYREPAKIRKTISKGDDLAGLSRVVKHSEEGASYSTMEGIVESKKGGFLTVKSSNEDCSFEPVHVEDIRETPALFSINEFLALKPRAIVLEFVDPACCCCNPYFRSHKITSQRRNCYLVQDHDNSGTEAAFSSQLISTNAF